MMRSLLPIACWLGYSWGLSLEALQLDILSSPANQQELPRPQPHRGHEIMGSKSFPWPIIDPVQSLEPEMLEGRWFGVISNLMTFAMLDGPARCITKDMYFAEHPQSLQVMSTADIVWPDTGKMERRQMGGHLEVPFGDGRIHASVGLLSARRFREESNMMVIKKGKSEESLDERELDYIIITDPAANILVVLARDVDHFMDEHLEDVMGFLDEYAFTQPWNRPIMVNHTMCNYTEPKPPTVPVEVYDEDKMKGRWFQMMGNFFVGHFVPFEAKAKCVVVDFVAGEQEGMFKLIGSKTDIETGEQMFEEGMIIQDPEAATTAPGIYRFQPSSTKGSNFWVLAVGPTDTDQFEWAIVSDPLGLSLWVFGRDVSKFNSKYKSDVLNLLKTRRFEQWWNKPVFIDHKDCKYPEQPKPVSHTLWAAV